MKISTRNTLNLFVEFLVYMTILLIGIAGFFLVVYFSKDIEDSVFRVISLVAGFGFFALMCFIGYRVDISCGIEHYIPEPKTESKQEVKSYFISH